MTEREPTYAQLQSKLAEAAQIIETIKQGQTDAIVTSEHILVLRLKETEEQFRRASELSDRLNRIHDALHATLDRNAIMRQLLEEGVAALGCDTGAISLRRENQWIVSQVQGMPRELIGAVMSDDQEPHAVIAIQTRQPVAVADVCTDARVNRDHLRRHQIRAVLVAPLITRDTPFGVIYFNCHHAARFFSREEVNFVHHLAGTASIALDNANLLAEHRKTEKALRRMNESLEERVAERTAQLQLLSDVATAVNEADHSHQAFDYVLRRVSEYLGWAFGCIFRTASDDPDILVPEIYYNEDTPRRFERFITATRELRPRRGQGLPGRVYVSGQPEWSLDPAGDLIEGRADAIKEAGLACAAAFPIRAGHEIVGVMEFFATEPIEASERLITTMTAVGTQIGRAFERDRLHRRISSAMLAEQRRVGATLHDSISQQLAGLALSAEKLTKQLEKAESPQAQALRKLGQGIRQAQKETRRIARGLFPITEETGAFRSALRELAYGVREQYEIDCAFDCQDTFEITDSDVATHLFYIAGEAIRNAVQHGRPEHLGITARREGRTLTLKIEDDGIGLPDKIERLRSTGLRIMHYRADVIGAELEIGRRQTGGTFVTCRLKKEETHAEK